MQLQLLDKDVAEFKAAWNAGMTCEKIGEIFGICKSSVSWRAKALGLPLRKHSSSFNKDDFTEAYESGMSISQMTEKFNMSRGNVHRRIRTLGLTARKPVRLFNEKEFREAYRAGISSAQLAEKFHISRSNVYWRLTQLGLPTRERQKYRAREPVMNSPEPVVEHEIIPRTPEPVIAERTLSVQEQKRPKQKTLPFIAPTLRELQRRQQQEEMRRAEREYKIINKENGFGSLINQVLSNSERI
jgi:hypothetical protein